MKNFEQSKLPVIKNLTELRFEKEKLKYKLMIEEDRVRGDIGIVQASIAEAVKTMLMGAATTLVTKLIYHLFKKAG
ncbi:MAG: hypothetical protein ACOCYF_02100 [Bacteroidota bacterium]